MQFGRLHAVLLVLLGGLLLLVQVFFTFQGLDRSASQPQPTDQTAKAESRRDYKPLHAVEYIPGVAGAGLVVLGTLALVRRQKEILAEFSKEHPESKPGAEPRHATPR